MPPSQAQQTPPASISRTCSFAEGRENAITPEEIAQARAQLALAHEQFFAQRGHTHHVVDSLGEGPKGQVGVP